MSDLNSANGTFVNDERIQRKALKSGDLVSIGAYQFSWAYVGEEIDGTTVSVPKAEVREAIRARQQDSQPEEVVQTIKILPKQPAAQREAMIAARKIVEAAEAYNRAQGHENDGFLSTTYGFMPVEPPLLALPAPYLG